MDRLPQVLGKFQENSGKYALKMRIRGNAACCLRSRGECRKKQKVCGEVEQTPCIRSKQINSELPLFPVLVAAVAVDLAANFAAGPARAVNVHVSGPRTDRRDQFVEFSSANAAFICEVSYIDCRDGARYGSWWRRTRLSAGWSIAEVGAKDQ